jgi:hypothetical protein
LSLSAIWRRLDRPGHDAALLRPHRDGWLLQGVAAFAHEAGPASVAYDVEVDAAWTTKRGRLRGFLGVKTFEHDIQREREVWLLNGAPAPGLEHLLDLDYGFTPATNALQLRRAAPPLGRTISLPVAWFDLDSASLTELPQTYERLDGASYRYVAPTVPYEGVLTIGSNGFVKSYPGLWRLEAQE